jgi:hypothetical protein
MAYAWRGPGETVISLFTRLLLHVLVRIRPEPKFDLEKSTFLRTYTHLIGTCYPQLAHPQRIQ